MTDPHIREVIGFALKKDGFATVEAENGTAGAHEVASPGVLPPPGSVRVPISATHCATPSAQTGPVAFRWFVTDALDAEAARFYAHFGLAPLGDDLPCRRVLDLRPLLAGRSPA